MTYPAGRAGCDGSLAAFGVDEDADAGGGGAEDDVPVAAVAAAAGEAAALAPASESQHPKRPYVCTSVDKNIPLLQTYSAALLHS